MKKTSSILSFYVYLFSYNTPKSNITNDSVIDKISKLINKIESEIGFILIVTITFLLKHCISFSTKNSESEATLRYNNYYSIIELQNKFNQNKQIL